MNTQQRLSRNRRGISPLIATVLLLAFAVAIGTMAVSYVLDATKESACANVAIALDGTDNVCLSGQRATFIIVNKGEVPLTTVLVRLIGRDQSLEERRLSAGLDAGEASKLNFEYVTVDPTGTRVTIVPVIAEDGEQVCSEREVITTIGPC